MLFAVVECVVGVWLRVCGRACLQVQVQASNVSRLFAFEGVGVVGGVGRVVVV